MSQNEFSSQCDSSWLPFFEHLNMKQNDLFFYVRDFLFLNYLHIKQMFSVHIIVTFSVRSKCFLSLHVIVRDFLCLNCCLWNKMFVLNVAVRDFRYIDIRVLRNGMFSLRLLWRVKSVAISARLNQVCEVIRNAVAIFVEWG